MFFGSEFVSFNIIEVIRLEQSKVNMRNTRRNFDAVSFRPHADTTLVSRNGTYHLDDGTVCFIPRGVDYTRISEYDELIVVHIDAAHAPTDKIEFFKAKRPELFHELFERMLELFLKGGAGYKHACAAVLHEILAECCKERCDGAGINPKIKNSVDYMTENFRRHTLTVKEIADRSFMSEVYFRRLFKAEFGMTPQSYLIKLRIQNATELISTGYYSLKEVAYLSGYNDYKYFTSEFRRATGVSPSKYVYNYDKSLEKQTSYSP